MVTKQIATGAVIFYSLSQFSNRSRLKSGWNLIGHGDVMPEERENVSVLKDSLTEVFEGTRNLVRPLSTKNGFVVVREARGEEENTFETVMTAKVFGADPPVITGNQSKSADIQAAYAKHAGRVTAHQVSSALVRIIGKLGGVSLRPRGAIYFLPGDKARDWELVGDVVADAAEDGTSTAYLIEHNLDANAVIAVRDAIVFEVFSEAKRLNEEITSGDLGERAIRTRKAEARLLKEKVLRYEDMLSVGLNHLKTALDSVEQANATASLLLAANPFDTIEDSHHASSSAV